MTTYSIRVAMLCNIAVLWVQACSAQGPPTNAKPSVAATIWLEPRAGDEDRSGLSPRDIQRSDGLIDQFDDQAIAFHQPNNETKTTAAESRVIWIEPANLNDAVNKSIATLYERKGQVDIAPLLNELKQSHPVWLSQWLGMHLWQATYIGEKSAATLELINQLDAQPMPSLIVGGLPIRWTDDELSKIAMAAALDHLRDKREATLLTAASWLLDSEHDGDGREVLRRLASESKRKPIRALAGLLLEMPLSSRPASQLSPQTLKTFQRLPITLSAGPTQRLAAWYQLHGQQDRAVEMTLRSILITPRPNPLSNLPKESDELWKELSTGLKGER